MPAKVVDASVLAAWCFREPRAAEAAELIKDCELYAPVLLAYEVTSIARRKSVTYPENSETINKALQIALSIPVYLMNVDHLSVLQLALSTNLTTYDASYLYLARKLGIPLVTFDRILQREAQKE